MDKNYYEKTKNIINKMNSHHDKLVLCTYYGILMCDIDDYRAYIKKVFDKPIITQKEIKETTRTEAKAILSSFKYD